MSSGGPLLPKARAALRADRSRSPFQVGFVHFRPMSWPKGGSFSKTELLKLPRAHGVSPFQRPVEGQPVLPPRLTPGRPMPRSFLRCTGTIQTEHPLLSRKVELRPLCAIEALVQMGVSSPSWANSWRRSRWQPDMLRRESSVPPDIFLAFWSHGPACTNAISKCTLHPTLSQ